MLESELRHCLLVVWKFAITWLASLDIEILRANIVWYLLGSTVMIRNGQFIRKRTAQ